MNFCENCNYACDEPRCPVCGRRKLREVCDNDYCFLIEANQLTSDFVESTLSMHEISFATIPSGTGVRTALGLNLENNKIFVRYKDLPQAQQLLKDEEQARSDRRKAELLNNAEKLHISVENMRSVAKGLDKRKADIDELKAACKDIVQNASEVADRGNILTDANGGHYYIVKTENRQLTINSVSFEILSAKTYN